MTKLDEIALSVELVLISIIEAVALTFLAQSAIPLLNGPEWLQFLPSILAGLTILLVFWSQAILHAVSFIRWPLRMEHMLLYFVAAFVQAIAYSEIVDIARWFLWWSAFSLLALVIYAVDLKIIHAARVHFDDREGGRAYIADVEHRHMNELIYLVPVALAFNVIAAALILGMPTVFDTPAGYIGLGTLQFLISLGALVDCVRNFRSRSEVLPKLFG